MQLFHERHRQLLLLSILGGVYLPSLSLIIPWKPVNTLLKGYTVALSGLFLFLGIIGIRHIAYLAENLVDQIMAANNICDYVMSAGRVWLFNVNRNQAQGLYDLWDDYFTGDGHDKIRKKLLDDLKKPNRKFIIGCASLILFMMSSWAAEQFTHEDCEFSVPLGVPFHHRNPEYLIWCTITLGFHTLYSPMLVSVDMLIMEPMTWITAELMRLRMSLAEILNTIQIRDNGEIICRRNGVEWNISTRGELESEIGQVDKRIKMWIVEHQKLLIFHRKMAAVNQWPLTVQLICTTTAICLVSYLLAMRILRAFDSFTGFLGYLPRYTLFYLISRYGDLLKNQAAGVFDSAFTTNWTIYPKHIQRNLVIIAMRANYPVSTKIMKLFPLGSITYFQILRTAYSFYSFLSGLDNQEENDEIA